MKGQFVVRIGNELKSFSDYEDIPETFDHLIKFLPDIPPPPHTEDQHKVLETHCEILKNLINREKNVSNIRS